MPFLDVLQISLLAGLIGLDRLAFGQFMISQPIVAAPIVGLVMGDLNTGLLIGAVLELFWLRGLPVGGHVPKDATLAAILTAALAVGASPGRGTPDVAWMAWVFLWMGLLMSPAPALDRWVRRKNAFLIDVAQSEGGFGRGIARAVWMGLGVFYLYYFGLTLTVLWLTAGALQSAYGLLSPALLPGLRLFFFLIPAMGVASLLTRKAHPRGRLFTIAGAAVSVGVFLGFGLDGTAPLAVLLIVAVPAVFVEERLRSV
jgi:mannose/fructose/N-acetylgalactosamine-specific phosphotransferase system component IIC